jgi:hypothetical protein
MGKFGKKQEESDEKNEACEQTLKNDFGLSRQGDNWAYCGRGALDVASAQKLYDAKMCMGMINYIRTESKEEFDSICIVPGKPTLIICNTKPPLGLATTLQPEEAAKMVASILEATKSKIIEYQNTFMLRLF